MNIKIYGTGCPKCKTLAANVVAALAKDGLAAEVEKVTDIDAIVARGILSTPTLESTARSSRLVAFFRRGKYVESSILKLPKQPLQRQGGKPPPCGGSRAQHLSRLRSLVWSGPFYAETPKRNPFRKPSRNRAPTRQ